MRILCSVTPMDGVFGPFVPLGRALADAGHEVMVATGPDLQAKVARLGFAAALAGPSAMEGAIEAMADPTVQTAGPEERWRFPATMFGGVIAPRKLPVLRELADSFAPDLVVHPSVDLAAPLLAAERGLPSVCYGFMHPLESPVVRGIADRLEPLWKQAGLPGDPQAGLYRHRYLDPCPPSLRRDRGPAEVVARSIRPEAPGDAQATLPSWIEELGTRPALYVSLGTVPFFNQPSRFQQLLQGLVDEDLDLVVTVSELHDPAALGSLPPNVHVEQWLPLAPLLPRCDGVLCHAGSGTTLAALTAGLPLVLLPDGADQFTNAESCQAGGVARTLKPEEITATAVRDAVRAILSPDAPEQGAARLIAREIAAMPAATNIVHDLESLAYSDTTAPTQSAAL
jgi:UDP:flavonoid glycosyltransferase YjiC (YdhE family)